MQYVPLDFSHPSVVYQLLVDETLDELIDEFSPRREDARMDRVTSGGEDPLEIQWKSNDLFIDVTTWCYMMLAMILRDVTDFWDGT